MAARGPVNGLTNKTWDGEHITSGQAATEDQLQKVEQNVNQKISNVDQKVDKVAKQHTTVSVNGGQAAGNLIMEKTPETDEKGANYDISLSVDGITDIKRVAVDGHTVATLDDGMKFAGDSGEALKQKLNSTTNIKGGAAGELSDGNIGVVSDGNDTLTVKLAKDIKGLDSVEANTVNATTVNTTRFNVAGDSTHNAITIKQGDVNMGGNTINGVAPGKVSPDSTEAVNGSQLYARDQAIGKLGNTVNHLDNKINRAGAGAAALAALHPQDFDPDDKWDFAAGYGNYHGASAAAIGAFYRPTEDVMVSVGGSMGGGENMVNAGVTFKLGQHNHVSNSRVAMAKEIRDLKATVGQLTQMVNQLTGNGGDRTLPLRKGDTLFPDVPKNHWAYDYVTKLAQAGLLEGYPDGEFKGNRMMTRYEFATLVYRAIMGGAAADPKLNQGGTLDRLVDEFGDELQYIRIVVIDRDKDGKPTIERVRTVEDDRKHHHGKEREQQPLEQGL
ncbi:S-layer homology domain-containing protein [uncultured Acidaminococcus sp.]|uniref:S-layer homology domain-containing protein n=1 Tax=uncultured Acidaminococcus sp. TaxID=352152 RepID=UPI002666A895|nr:S-layer homology domain-containing protein [uncultured Acidaminococcus sp.]